MAYVVPTPAELKLRYAAFAAVDDVAVQYWLTDAERVVDTSWAEADYAPALIAYAAHRMAEEKVSGFAMDAASSAQASGLTNWKSASVSMQFSEASAARVAAGGLQSTRYGLDYLDLLARRGHSFGTSKPGALPCDGYILGYPHA